MSACTSSITLMSSLTNHGKRLAALLHKAKLKEDHHKEVRDLIFKLIEDFQTIGGYPTFPETKMLMTNALSKVEETLQTFLEVDPDNASEYRDLAVRVKEFSSKLHGRECILMSGELSHHQVAKDIGFEVRDTNLTDKETQCLFCVSLFPPGVNISKSELINWWVGMDLINDPLEGDKVLGSLVAKAVIQHTIGNRKTSNMYRVPTETVCAKVKLKMREFGYQRQEGSFSVTVIHHYDDGVAEPAAEMIAAVLNVSERTLNFETFKWLSEMKNVQVVCLGGRNGFQHDIAAEDILVMDKALQQTKEVRFLSLQGISGIVELPNSVSRLENLKVLDLRACRDLKILPVGIESLKRLIYLDLSECYQLLYLPKGIITLPELRILKGFVISPDDCLEITRSCALFRDLSELKQLRKLTVLTKRMSFPTSKDLLTLCQMQQLENLKIEWPESASDTETQDDISGRFPATLKKLKLEAVSKSTLSRLLGMMSTEKDICLEKLYIKRGRI